MLNTKFFSSTDVDALKSETFKVYIISNVEDRFGIVEIQETLPSTIHTDIVISDHRPIYH